LLPDFIFGQQSPAKIQKLTADLFHGLPEVFPVFRSPDLRQCRFQPRFELGCQPAIIMIFNSAEKSLSRNGSCNPSTGYRARKAGRSTLKLPVLISCT